VRGSENDPNVSNCGNGVVYGYIAIIRKSGKVSNSKFPMRETRLIIGRDEDCDICVRNDCVSGRHCKIQVEPVNQNLVITNLGENGTFVDGKKITQPTTLRHGAIVTVHPRSLEITYPEDKCQPTKNTQSSILATLKLKDSNSPKRQVSKIKGFKKHVPVSDDESSEGEENGEAEEVEEVEEMEEEEDRDQEPEKKKRRVAKRRGKSVAPSKGRGSLKPPKSKKPRRFSEISFLELPQETQNKVDKLQADFERKLLEASFSSHEKSAEGMLEESLDDDLSFDAYDDPILENHFEDVGRSPSSGGEASNVILEGQELLKDDEVSRDCVSPLPSYSPGEQLEEMRKKVCVTPVAKKRVSFSTPLNISPSFPKTSSKLSCFSSKAGTPASPRRVAKRRRSSMKKPEGLSELRNEEFLQLETPQESIVSKVAVDVVQPVQFEENGQDDVVDVLPEEKSGSFEEEENAQLEGEPKREGEEPKREEEEPEQDEEEPEQDEEESEQDEEQPLHEEDEVEEIKPETNDLGDEYEEVSSLEGSEEEEVVETEQVDRTLGTEEESQPQVDVNDDEEVDELNGLGEDDGQEGHPEEEDLANNDSEGEEAEGQSEKEEEEDEDEDEDEDDEYEFESDYEDRDESTEDEDVDLDTIKRVAAERMMRDETPKGKFARELYHISALPNSPSFLAFLSSASSTEQVLSVLDQIQDSHFDPLDHFTVAMQEIDKKIELQGLLNVVANWNLRTPLDNLAMAELLRLSSQYENGISISLDVLEKSRHSSNYAPGALEYAQFISSAFDKNVDKIIQKINQVSPGVYNSEDHKDYPLATWVKANLDDTSLVEAGLETMKKHQIEPNSRNGYYDLVKYYQQNRTVQQTLELIQNNTAKGIFIDNFIGNDMIRYLGENQQGDDAMKFMKDHMSERKIEDQTTYNLLLSNFAKAMNITQFTNTLEEMTQQNYKPATSVFNTLLRNLAKDKDGKSKEIPKIFAEMQRMGVPANARTYNSLIQEALQNNDSEKAWKLFEEMKQSEITPNNFAYRSMLRLCETDRALELLEEMRLNGVKPDRRVERMVLGKCFSEDPHTRLEKIHLAFQVFDAQLDSNLDSFKTVLELCKQNVLEGIDKENTVKRAGAYAVEMEERGIEEDEEVRESRILINGEGKGLDAALDVFEEARASDLPLSRHSFTYLLKLIADNGNPHDTRALVLDYFASVHNLSDDERQSYADAGVA